MLCSHSIGKKLVHYPQLARHCLLLRLSHPFLHDISRAENFSFSWPLTAHRPTRKSDHDSFFSFQHEYRSTRRSQTVLNLTWIGLVLFTLYLSNLNESTINQTLKNTIIALFKMTFLVTAASALVFGSSLTKQQEFRHIHWLSAWACMNQRAIACKRLDRESERVCVCFISSSSTVEKLVPMRHSESSVSAFNKYCMTRGYN